MANYRLTIRADSEIVDIYEYSILNFGIDEGREYILGLHKMFEVLADNQSWGNDYTFIMEGLRRYEYRAHSIYYLAGAKGILIVRFLGYRQDPARHF